MNKKDKLIKDIRVSFDWKADWTFYWFKSPNYFWIYEEIFINLLKRKWFTCNNYNHIYIKLSEKKDISIYESDFDFFKYWAVSFNKHKYIKWNESIKNSMALNSIYEWLLDLGKRDWLNIEKITTTYKEILKKWIDTELIFKEIDHKLYNLKVTYSPANPYLYTIFFILTDKINNIVHKREVNKWNKDFMYDWLQNITLSSKNITIKPSQSFRSTLQWTMKDKFQIKINNIINNNILKDTYQVNQSSSKEIIESKVIDFNNKESILKKIFNYFK